jgi:hypothetical protein
MQLTEEVVPRQIVRFGSGHTVATTTGAHLGQQPVLVVEELVQPLISPNAMLEQGGELYLTNAGGTLTNSDGSSGIPIARVAGINQVWLIQYRDSEISLEPGSSIGTRPGVQKLQDPRVMQEVTLYRWRRLRTSPLRDHCHLPLKRPSP